MPWAFPVTADNIKVNTTSGTVIQELLKHGLGISFLTKDAETLVPDIELVLPDLDPIPVPIWLVTHRELHTSRRIRLVFDFLGRGPVTSCRWEPSSLTSAVLLQPR